MIHDISVTLHNRMPTWPDSPGFKLMPLQKIDDGDNSNNSMIQCDLHAGTHVDAPSHFISGGRTVEQIPLTLLIGTAAVVHFKKEPAITAQDLADKGIPKETKRLLIRTFNSRHWEQDEPIFEPEFVALTADAASWIVAHGIQLVGIDYLSIQRFRDPPDTHRILLESGVVILEGLNLHNIDPGQYELTCLPLKIQGAEGAPARAILRSPATEERLA